MDMYIYCNGISPPSLSGVKIGANCISILDAFKEHKKYRYIVFHIRDELEIDVEVLGPRESSYEQFLADLQFNGPNSCRYGLYDYEYIEDNCAKPPEQDVAVSKKQQLFVMTWCPSTAPLKQKMLYSSSFYALRKYLSYITVYIQATDCTEITREHIEEKLHQCDLYQKSFEKLAKK